MAGIFNRAGGYGRLGLACQMAGWQASNCGVEVAGLARRRCNAVLAAADDALATAAGLRPQLCQSVA